jgi:PKD repeat protein
MKIILNERMNKPSGKRKGGTGMKHVICLAILILLATSISAMAVELASVGGPNPDVPGFVGYAPNRIVIKFDPSTLRGIDNAAMARGRTGLPALDQVGTRHGVRSLRPQFPGAKKKTYKGKVIDLSGWHEVEFAGRADVPAAIAEYKAVPGVLDAQPVGIHKVNKEPNDWNYINTPYQWHLPRIQAPQAWDIETGNPGIIVAVMDTGVRYFHRDLGGANASFSNPGAAEGNMWINTAERYGIQGVDDDGNGYVDDWIGWDFVHVVDNWPLMQCFPGEDCLDPDNDPRDFQGHGTHCAGNVATMNNNSYSQASVAGGWGDGNFVGGPGNGVKVMDLRIGWRAIYGILFDVGMVDMEFAAQGLYYAAVKGAKIASCSWGSDNSGGIDEAIDYFLAGGGLIFKAAGNDSSETADYLCARNDVLCVAATDQNDCKASFSTYGSWVDISAPGVGIWSSWHNPDDPVNDYISTMDGTSMATPLSASVAALIWSQNPTWTAAQVRQRLFDSADRIDSLGCNAPFSGKLGAGRINAFKAVETASPPSPPVADFTGSPTSGTAPLTVNFTDSSTGRVDSWSWNFGDGGTSSAQNPAHTYTAAGTYNVSLAVTGPGGTDTDVKTGYITVSTPSPAPVADFTANPVTGPAPLTVQFTDQSTGTISSWDWNFGDGFSSTVQNPGYTYNTAGLYTVSLKVTGPGGSNTKTKTGYINVTGLIPAGVTEISTGIYSGRGKAKTFHLMTLFSPGDEVVFRAYVEDGVGPLSGAVVEIGISGPVTTTIISGPSDNNGIAEAKWKTSAPKGKNSAGGTPTGTYTATVTNVTASGHPWDGTGTTTSFTVN